MKNQGVFSSKDKSKKLKCHLLQCLFGALRVRINIGIVFSLPVQKYRRNCHTPPASMRHFAIKFWLNFLR